VSEITPLADAALAAEAQAAATRPLAFAELAVQRQGKLPHDHPPHPSDTISLGSRGRELIAKLRPAIVRAGTFWDHRIRTIAIGPRRLSVDPSGSYRLE
jgi:hypothetical protein